MSDQENGARTPLPGRPVRGSESGRPVMALLDLLGRRWCLRVLWELRETALGFRALQGRCDGMSASVLSTRLQELEQAKLIERDPSGAWCLAPSGRDLLALLLPLERWSRHWAETLDSQERETE